MTPQLPQYCAVVTGDLVRSRHLSPARFESVQEAMRRGGDEIHQQFQGQAPLPLEQFRGDGWQLLVSRPENAFRIALYFRAFLRAEANVDTRFAIGVGTIEPLTANDISTGRGEAFLLSGDLLDQKSSVRMRFAGPRARSLDDGAQGIEVILVVLDELVRRWTPSQARAVCGALLDWTQEKIAENWPEEPITQQAASQHLARAGWDGIRRAVGYYEDVMKRWFPK